MDGLRDKIQRMATERLRDPARAAQPVPTYLLSHQPDEDDLLEDGRVICVPGCVRSHVSLAELDAWHQQLAPARILLQVLRADAPECEPEADEQASIDAHLNAHAERIDAREAQRREVARLDALAHFERHRGCGQRLHEPGVDPSMQAGDMLYYAPPDARPHDRPILAVVQSVRRRDGCRTGEIEVLPWDETTGRLGSSRFVEQPACVAGRGQGVRGRGGLMPRCCGDGATCPDLLACRLWPNGDAMTSDDFDMLNSIGWAYQSLHGLTRKRRAERPDYSDEDRAALKRLKATYPKETLVRYKDVMLESGARRLEMILDGLNCKRLQQIQPAAPAESTSEAPASSTSDPDGSADGSDGEVEIDTAGPD